MHLIRLVATLLQPYQLFCLHQSLFSVSVYNQGLDIFQNFDYDIFDLTDITH